MAVTIRPSAPCARAVAANSSCLTAVPGSMTFMNENTRARSPPALAGLVARALRFSYSAADADAFSTSGRVMNSFRSVLDSRVLRRDCASGVPASSRSLALARASSRRRRCSSADDPLPPRGAAALRSASLAAASPSRAFAASAAVSSTAMSRALRTVRQSDAGRPRATATRSSSACDTPPGREMRLSVSDAALAMFVTRASAFAFAVSAAVFAAAASTRLRSVSTRLRSVSAATASLALRASMAAASRALRASTSAANLRSARSASATLPAIPAPVSMREGNSDASAADRAASRPARMRSCSSCRGTRPAAARISAVRDARDMCHPSTS